MQTTDQENGAKVADVSQLLSYRSADDEVNCVEPLENDAELSRLLSSSAVRRRVLSKVLT